MYFSHSRIRFHTTATTPTPQGTRHAPGIGSTPLSTDTHTQQRSAAQRQRVQFAIPRNSHTQTLCIVAHLAGAACAQCPLIIVLSGILDQANARLRECATTAKDTLQDDSSHPFVRSAAPPARRTADTTAASCVSVCARTRDVRRNAHAHTQ